MIIHAFSVVLCPFDATDVIGRITDHFAIIGLGVYLIHCQCSGFGKLVF